jgi:hypothetical protein
MIGHFPIAVALALAVVVIAMLTVVALRSRSKRKQRPEKWEKAEIMKQLLALSESENSAAAKTPSIRVGVPAPRQAKRTAHAYPKRPAKTTLPIRSKTR